MKRIYLAIFLLTYFFTPGFCQSIQAVPDSVRIPQNFLLKSGAARKDWFLLDPINVHYPIPYLDNGQKAANYITVGWNRPLFNYRLAHPYSNYGQQSVDLFAPGSDIWSTVPGDGYDFKSGSSMSTPVVSGVAALLLSYFPQLSIPELKTILMRSSFKPIFTVNKPQTSNPVAFSSLSVSGGIINAYLAVEMLIGSLHGK